MEYIIVLITEIFCILSFNPMVLATTKFNIIGGGFMKYIKSLKYKLLLYVFCVCVIPYILSGVYISNIVFDRLQHDYYMRSNESMEQIHLKIKEGLIDPSSKAVTMIALDKRTIDLANMLGDKVFSSPAELDGNMDYQHLKIFCDVYPQLLGLGIATSAGGYLQYPETVLYDNYDPRTRLWYKQALEHKGTPFLTDPYMKTDGTLSMSFVHTFGDNANIMGVFAAGWNLQELNNIVNEVRIGSSAYIIILNQNDKFVVSPYHPEWLTKTPQELALAEFTDIKGKEGIIHKIEHDGKVRFMHVNISQETGWKVISFIDEAELMGQARQIVDTIIGVYFLTLLVILLGIFFVAEGIVVPVKKLVQGASAIASGNFDIRINNNREDELGILANSFNQMVDRLKDNFEKIQFQSEQLKKREHEYKTLVENAQDMIIRSDREHRFVYVNPAVKLYTELKPHAVIGKKHWEVGLPENISLLLEEIWAKVLKTGKEQWKDFEVTLVKGEKRHFQVHAVPECNHEGTVETVLSIVRNITEQKQMERQMARLDRLNLVGEMAASIAHEVRNPITAVRGFLQWMGQKKEMEQQYQEYFAVMIEEIDRANSIITEYLSMAKNKAVHLQMHNLNDIIQMIAPLMQADALVSNKNVRIELGEIPDMLLDETEIRQLLLNLVRNGLESMQQGGCVTIKTYGEGSLVTLEVRDQGSGISPEIVERLGIPFTTTKSEGTGLGLAVCYSIANRHNATINFKTGLRGTTAYVHFGTKNVQN
jgi:PAS domain S-box-containing protein